MPLVRTVAAAASSRATETKYAVKTTESVI
jgi:hypothetical protein